jgi:2-polyprenyl-6-methoxyphenol hydroxylase-like FAD-dependent oxidoreductase
MSEIDERATVIVVGAGPAGAALALLLARSGIDTLLLERHAAFEREFRGEGVQASGLRCLEQMGLADDVAALPQTRMRRATLGIAGRVVDMPIGRRCGSSAWCSACAGSCVRRSGDAHLSGTA